MAWFKSIDRTGTFPDWKQACGACKDCYTEYKNMSSTIQHSHRHQLKAELAIVAVDMNQHNIQLVENITKIIHSIASDNSAEKDPLLRVMNLNRVHLYALHAGGADKVGSVRLPSCELGVEECTLSGKQETLHCICVYITNYIYIYIFAQLMPIIQTTALPKKWNISMCP
jgi:hypothetical protein